MKTHLDTYDVSEANVDYLVDLLDDYRTLGRELRRSTDISAGSFLALLRAGAESASFRGPVTWHDGACSTVEDRLEPPDLYFALSSLVHGIATQSGWIGVAQDYLSSPDALSERKSIIYQDGTEYFAWTYRDEVYFPLVGTVDDYRLLIRSVWSVSPSLGVLSDIGSELHPYAFHEGQEVEKELLDAIVKNTKVIFFDAFDGDGFGIWVRDRTLAARLLPNE